MYCNSVSQLDVMSDSQEHGGELRCHSDGEVVRERAVKPSGATGGSYDTTSAHEGVLAALIAEEEEEEAAAARRAPLSELLRRSGSSSSSSREDDGEGGEMKKGGRKEKITETLLLAGRKAKEHEKKRYKFMERLKEKLSGHR